MHMHTSYIIDQDLTFFEFTNPDLLSFYLIPPLWRH